METDAHVEGIMLVVPTPEQYGGWARRPWVEIGEKIMVLWRDLLAKVELRDDGSPHPDSLHHLFSLLRNPGELELLRTSDDNQ